MKGTKKVYQYTHDVCNNQQKAQKKGEKQKKILPPSSWTRPINEIKKGHQSIAYKQLDTNYTEIWLSAYA